MKLVRRRIVEMKRILEKEGRREKE